ncbi:nitrate- and nitrite sensing domain-containing protein [Streptomyces sp. NPDC059009]|uniref:sensor histidine kinase n=1 Tax=Streptomyces sp. NPDC059009 TaxID=3346694 RepID=UPI0036BA624D
MRFRGKSIRRKIVALLLVPLVSLTAMWGFATYLTGRSADKLLNASYVVDKIGYPIEDTATVIQEERRRTLAYLADPGSSDALAALRRSRDATDEKVAQVESRAGDSELRDEVDGKSEERLNSLLEALGGIESLRRTVEEGTITRATALRLYTRLIDPCYEFLMTLHALDDVSLDQQGRALVGVTRARELLSREDALLGSALVLRRISDKEIRQVSDLIAQRDLLYEVSLQQLPEDDRSRFERYLNGAETTELRSMEQSVVESSAGTPRGITSDRWNEASAAVLKDLSQRDKEAGDRLKDRVEPEAVGVIVRLAVAGVLGLLALLVSIFLSVRIGRGLVRDLRRLRLEAHEASGVRLPGVLRRLAAGEQLDVETEAPRLTYGKDEIGQVGAALNTLQRAAVEATVKQADLRRGVSEVFVNLARRSQVLLHKQLTLLDTMERRTEDADELADLFRLDHLTTRMRRHAEGLVILSGAAPSRQWRKPVQLMDVVRAAVAEVEDYERVEVRRLPRIAVTGPAVADLTHLLAELLENATVFSPPHTAVQVLGEHVANGFTLEIHDRGLGMAADALLDANLRLAETPEFELSDTDRLGLFVVSRLAQRQNVRVSLQPSPYGGTTAVVFVPETLLTDDVPDTNGIGFRLDRPQRQEAGSGRSTPLGSSAAQLPGLPASLLDGPVELEAPVGMADLGSFPGAIEDEDSERGGLFRPRRRVAGVPGEQHQQARDERESDEREARRPEGLLGRDTHDVHADTADTPDPAAPVPLPRRSTPKLVTSHGRPVNHTRSRPTPDSDTGEERADRAPEPADRSLEKSGRLQESRTPDSRTSDSRTPERAETSTEAEALDRPRRPEPQSGWPDLTPPRAGSALGATDRSPGEAPESTGSSETGIAPSGLPRRRGRNSRPDTLPARSEAPEIRRDPAQAPDEAAPSGLPRRVRQANLAPQLKDGPERRTERGSAPAGTGPEERDADEVRSRMAALQRGWQRGRDENAAGDDPAGGTAPGTTSEGDGR